MKGQNTMGLDVWFRQDVARILAATQATLARAQGALPSLDPDQAGTYQRGFADALQAIALAFGLDAPGPVPAARTFSDPPFVVMERDPVQTSHVYSIVQSDLQDRNCPEREAVP